MTLRTTFRAATSATALVSFSLLTSGASYGSSTPAGKSDLTIKGLKFPNADDEGTSAVETIAELPQEPLKGFNQMTPFVLRAPDQEEAGSCLYMALTGIAEWLLASTHPQMSRASDGPLDLSERYLMNLAGLDEDSNGVKNWKTDSIYLFNKENKAVLNRSYRFTKGWYGENAKGDYIPAAPNAKGAQYGTSYNWINGLEEISGGAVPVPEFERKVLFADPENNQWNVGVAPADISERVKSALQTKKAPVLVIYNHYGYWHAVYIVGYDDNLSTGQCKFVEGFRTNMAAKPAKLRAQAAQAPDAASRDKLLAQAAKAEKTSVKFEGAYAAGGGCGEKGMFYVRDSIYGDKDQPTYDYDLSQKGDEGNYSKGIILREYDWLTYMSNHATQIYIK